MKLLREFVFKHPTIKLINKNHFAAEYGMSPERAQAYMFWLTHTTPKALAYSEGDRAYYLTKPAAQRLAALALDQGRDDLVSAILLEPTLRVKGAKTPAPKPIELEF